MPRFFRCSVFFLILLAALPSRAKTIELTLDSAVEIAMNNSYRIRQLKLGIERSRQWLRAERAGLKSKVYLDIKAPQFSAVSDYKWDSVQGRDIIVRQNTQMWWMNLAISQPVILFGYPTNGYLSINSRIYRYDQLDDGIWDTNFYNRYFLKFEQPFFQPNKLKNDLERAELRLEESELRFLEDQVDLMQDIADDYYALFRSAYEEQIIDRFIVNLTKLDSLARCSDQANGVKSIECIQIQIELANAREKKAQIQSRYRQQATRFKQRLRLGVEDSLIVRPEIVMNGPISINLEEALNYGFSLQPRLRLLEITQRQNELDLESVKAWNAFRVNVEMTYGLEKQNERFNELWSAYDNSYSATINAYVPLWDWGQRQARIEAQKITIQKTDLSIEEAKSQIESEIRTAVQNVQEYQQRASSMAENLTMAQEMTEYNLAQYAEGRISLQDLLQVLNRQRETETNYLEAVLGLKKSLLTLMFNTYYDFEHRIRLLDKYRS
ncbi:MAG: TolC family protein [candidate division KSB1 bacterium]|nr:TolC family protein [candidate division KSB1 bacterium]